jgi:predicted DNA-binding transcriptional regulator AlpA
MRNLVIEVEGEVRLTPLPGARTRIEVVPIGEDGNEKFLSKREVATKFGVSTRTIENWVKSETNPLPVIRGAGRMKFKDSDIVLWLTKVATTCITRNAH